MIKIENVEVMGWEHAIRGMRNPKNSWDRSDSGYYNQCDECYSLDYYSVGANDHKLMTALAKGGPVHAKYRRMITVYLDITAPLYWWKEFDTYKVGTVANSCSTMHKIHDKEFELSDFSCEHLLAEDIINNDEETCVCTPLYIMSSIMVDTLNHYRMKFLKADEVIKKKEENLDQGELADLILKRKQYWWQLIQLLPSSYNQKRTIMLNYEVLVGMYEHRKAHKLDEWREFCKWVESLPYSELITGKFEAGGEGDGNGQK